MIKKNFKGQSMIELVLGLGMISVIVGAIAVVTIAGLRNTQYSKNQVQATKLAQQNLEKVRAIKNTNSGVCLQSQVYSECSTWEDLWAADLGTVGGGCMTAVNSTGCLFEIKNSCTVAGGQTKALCLSFKTSRTINGTLSSQIIIEDEGNGDNAKRVTSRAFWTDGSGEHSSDLVTILSRR